MLSSIWLNDEKLKKINSGILALIIFINCYIVFLPLLPRVTYSFKPGIAVPSATNPAFDKSVDKLIIPSLKINDPLNEGSSLTELEKGLWMRPNGSTPDKLNNTIIAGHRFTYTSYNVPFYHLDKLVNGSDVYVTYKGKLYNYQVMESKIVKPTDQSVEAPTDNPILTLYTCTPIYRPVDRLVYVSKLISIDGQRL